MNKILVIGSLNLDMVCNVEHIPAVGETVLARDITMVPGGKGANQACAAGRLGAQVALLGAVGRDEQAEVQVRNLAAAGVDVSRLIRREKQRTGSAFVAVNPEGDNSIVVMAGANATLQPADIDRNLDLLRECSVVLLQLEIPLETVLYAAQKAKELGKTVILDPAPAPASFPAELYCCVDVIKPNETELSILSGVVHAEEHLHEAARVLREMGAKNVLVTLGAKGAYLCPETGEEALIPAQKVRAVDTTAAGDAFTAAFACRIAMGDGLLAAASFANQVSAIVVTRPGAQSSIPTLKEVEAAAAARK
jgi:ribokinase